MSTGLNTRTGTKELTDTDKALSRAKQLRNLGSSKAQTITALNIEYPKLTAKPIVSAVFLAT